MKKTFALFIGLAISWHGIFAQSHDFGNGNGTIIETKIIEMVQWQVRKHNQTLQFGRLAGQDSAKVYESFSIDSTLLGSIKTGEYITIDAIAEARIADEYHVWIKLTTKSGLIGWCLLGKYSFTQAQFRDPYFGNRWEIAGSIRTNITWTIRKMIYQRVTVWEVLNIRDNPGLFGTKVIGKIIPPTKGNRQVNLEVLEATEENELIDGRNDRWLRVEYNGISGWIFGGYATVERGGYKYYTPENIILAEIGYY